MKLIFIKDEEGIKYINPLYVRSVKQIHSDINDDWCIVIEMDDHTVETILFKTEEKANRKLIDILVAMETAMTVKGE